MENNMAEQKEEVFYGTVLIKAKEIMDFILESRVSPTLKEISENTPINMRFLGNGVPYKNALDKVGVKYKTITDDVVLSPSRKDVLYTIIGNTTVKEDQTEFPDYTIIEVYVCEICR